MYKNLKLKATSENILQLKLTLKNYGKFSCFMCRSSIGQLLQPASRQSSNTDQKVHALEIFTNHRMLFTTYSGSYTLDVSSSIKKWCSVSDLMDDKTQYFTQNRRKTKYLITNQRFWILCYFKCALELSLGHPNPDFNLKQPTNQLTDRRINQLVIELPTRRVVQVADRTKNKFQLGLVQ